MIPDITPGFSSETAYDPNDIVADSKDLFAREVTLVSGQNVVRGAVLGKITTGGKYALSLSAGSDGSQTPVAIAAQDVDASGGDKKIQAFFSGDFKASKLTYGTAHTKATVYEALAARGIKLHDDQLY
jgi:hypothetical protein